MLMLAVMMIMMTMSHHLCHLFSLSLLVLVYSTLQQATPPLSYHVTEEQARGTLVANLSADARLSPEVLSKVRFRFLSDSQPLFVIDGSSGVIRTGEVIDRDHASLCRYQVTCIIELDVALQPLQYFQVYYFIAPAATSATLSRVCFTAITVDGVICLADTCHVLHGLHDWTVSSEHLRFMFLVSSLFFFVWFCAAD